MDRSRLVKYPRTMNLPHSRSNSSDDVWWADSSRFDGHEVVVTEKMDGECTTMYRDHIHARSLDSVHHASRAWVKRLHGRVAHDIPDGMRVCGENVYACHSIYYTDLPTYFFVYGVYDGDACLSWDDTVEVCGCLGLETVPVTYRGPWDEAAVRAAWTGVGRFPTFESPEGREGQPLVPTPAEGYVVRVAEGFRYDEFGVKCAKWVRDNHVRTTGYWATKPVVPNVLATHLAGRVTP